jgi:hypothetical protein
MIATLVGLHGPLTGKRFPVRGASLTLGRTADSDVVLATRLASRTHAELRYEAGEHVLHDRNSRNGVEVNGRKVTVHPLRSGDEITVGEEVFRFELVEEPERVEPNVTYALTGVALKSPVLRVTVSGGGPVGLAFALLLEQLLGTRVSITLYESRWCQGDGGVIKWKTSRHGNARRQQVVTLQSRQYLKLPGEVQDRLFTDGGFTEMWPPGPDSIEGKPPRNVRIAYIEDQLLADANEKSRIRLVPEAFDPVAAADDLAGQHVLAICEGSRSRTREHFADRFGAGDTSPYSLDGVHLQDVVLGLRVKSKLPDPMAVLLTVAQNRFLLNSLRGEGFLNIRLTSEETKEAVGIDPVRQAFTECIQGAPCLMEKTVAGDFSCSRHDTLFLPALLRRSPFWGRVAEGLKLFGVAEDDLTAVTVFRLDMTQRGRFSAALSARTAATPGTFGFLLGDAANAVHFWPGRGLNSGLAGAVSLARCLASRWSGTGFRDADFTRHEALMAMLQYRHKTRAWRQMTTTDAAGATVAIKNLIARGIEEGRTTSPDRGTDLDTLMERLRQIRSRLAARTDGLPDDATLRAHLERLDDRTLHTLVVSEPWDSAGVGGEEVDVDWLLAEADTPLPAGPTGAVRPRPRAGSPVPAAVSAGLR